MPRAFSSGRRSVSLPVSAFTSHVLPWSMWPAVPTVSGISEPSLLLADRGLDQAVLQPLWLEAFTCQQPPPFVFGPFAPAREHEHQEVEPLAAVRLVSLRNHAVEDEDTGAWVGGAAYVLEDPCRALVVHPVEDPRQGVRIACGNGVVEAARHELATVGDLRRLDPWASFRNDLRQVEEDTAEPRVPAKELDEHRARAAADVHHDLVAPRQVCDPFDPLVCSGLHRAVEERQRVRFIAQPLLEVHAEREAEDSLAGTRCSGRLGEGGVPIARELKREFVPALLAVGAQQLRGGRVPEHARLAFREHAV